MKLKLLLGTSISLLFTYLSFWKPDFGRILEGAVYSAFFGSPRIDLKLLGQSLVTANLLFVLIVMLLVYWGWWIRAWRWQVIARPVKRIKSNLAFSALMIGYLGNNVLPFRAGEFMRAYIVGRRAEIPVSSALAMVVIERVLDMMMLLICFGLSMLLFPIPGFVRKAGLLVLAGTGGLIIFLLLLIFRREEAEKIVRSIFIVFPKNLRARLLKLVSDFTVGLEIFKQGTRLLITLAWTFFMWGIYFLIIYISFFIFNIYNPNYPLIYYAPFTASVVMLTLTTTGVALPSAPGAVGTYHGIALFGLGLFQVPSELGLSYAILLHLTNFFPMTIIGVYCLFREGLKLADISSGKSWKDVKLES